MDHSKSETSHACHFRLSIDTHCVSGFLLQPLFNRAVSVLIKWRLLSTRVGIWHSDLCEQSRGTKENAKDQGQRPHNAGKCSGFTLLQLPFHFLNTKMKDWYQHASPYHDTASQRPSKNSLRPTSTPRPTAAIAHNRSHWLFLLVRHSILLRP